MTQIQNFCILIALDSCMQSYWVLITFSVISFYFTEAIPINPNSACVNQDVLEIIFHESKKEKDVGYLRKKQYQTKIPTKKRFTRNISTTVFYPLTQVTHLRLICINKYKLCIYGGFYKFNDTLKLNELTLNSLSQQH